MNYYNFEKMSRALEDTIWVLKYDMYCDERGEFCNKDTPNAIKYTDCHGWYESEADARYAQGKLQGKYDIEKVYKRNVAR